MSSFTLKIIAIFTMLIDHLGFVVLTSTSPFYLISRLIGRISFPIFAFLISEGLKHTSSKKSYFKRLMLFAFLSEIPYDLCFNYNNQLALSSQLLYFLSSQNIYFTLSLGVLFVIVLENFKVHKIIYNLLAFAVLLTISIVIKPDYNSVGVLFIPSLFYADKYLAKHINNSRLYVIFVFMFMITYSISYRFFLASIVSIPILYFYNNSIGLYNSKNFYYFYPIHLIILFIIGNYFI